MKKNTAFRLTQILNDNHEPEMIPLLSPEEEKEMNEETFDDVLPILTLRNAVLFPGVVIPITVGRKKSIKLVKSVYEGKGDLAVASQKTSANEDPSFDDIYKVGTAAKILKLLTLPDGNTTVILQGKRRISINELVSTEPYLRASIQTLPENFPDVKDQNSIATIESLKDLAGKIINL